MSKSREIKPLTMSDIGKKGGQKTSDTHGEEFYSEIGRKGGEKVSIERGPEFYSEIGSMSHRKQ